MTPDDLKPGMWVTVLDAVPPETPAEDATPSWADDDEQDFSCTKHRWMHARTEAGVQYYCKLFGRALNIVALEYPIAFCEVLAMDCSGVQPLGKHVTFIDMRLVRFKPLSAGYVEALKQSVLDSLEGSKRQTEQAHDYFGNMMRRILAHEKDGD